MHSMRENYNKKSEEAMSKFSLIAPIINNTYPDKSETAYFNRVCEKPIKWHDGTTRHISPRTLKTWKHTYLKFGFIGLTPKRRSDIGSSRRIDADLAQDIQDLRIKYPKMSAAHMREYLIKHNYIDLKELSYSTIQRFFKNNPIPEMDDTQIKDRRAFEAELVNGLWQADTLYGPRVGQNHERTYLQSIIDDKSRKIVSSRFYLRDTAANFQKTFKHAISTHGIPNKLFVDNGGPYKNDQLTMICGNLDIVLCHAAVRDGAAKGKIERFNRTVRLKFLSQLDAIHTESIESLNNALNKWIKEYNETKHSSIKTTPLYAFNENSKTIKWFNGDSKQLDEMFMNAVYRKVANDSTIRLNQKLYDVPMEYIGKRIKIKYLPDDIYEVWLEKEDGSLFHLIQTNKCENFKTLRKNTKFIMNYKDGGN